MNLKAIYFMLLLTMPLFGFGQAKQSNNTLAKQELLNSLNDGPYVFIEDDQFIEKNIVNVLYVSLCRTHGFYAN